LAIGFWLLAFSFWLLAFGFWILGSTFYFLSSIFYLLNFSTLQLFNFFVPSFHRSIVLSFYRPLSSCLPVMQPYHRRKGHFFPPRKKPLAE